MPISTSGAPADPPDYLPSPPQALSVPTGSAGQGIASLLQLGDAEFAQILAYIEARGFTFEPWQVAAYITAVRSKPFVILAGVSGTGKSALPKLVADATGALVTTVPVRPDWHDSSELVGYERINGDFQPGHLLRAAATALQHPDRQHFVLLDEMNIARPEYYLAEVLSRIEEAGLLNGATGAPLRPEASGDAAPGLPWSSVYLPANLALIGSVNMDETTFGFSRKVLDRAFIIEFSEVDLTRIANDAGTQPSPLQWGSDRWRRTAATLAQHPGRNEPLVKQVISTLGDLNKMLAESQLQFGYRVRDEISIFCLNAQISPSIMQTTDGGQIDALDLAVSMKILPRIQGAGASIFNLLQQLASWAQPSVASSPSFPISAQRIGLMKRRLAETGFTNFWL